MSDSQPFDAARAALSTSATAPDTSLPVDVLITGGNTLQKGNP